jgi:LacI family transcriptional regulator
MSGARVVTIGQRDQTADAIIVDNAGGAASLAGALVSRGYRRFLVLAGPEYLCTSEDRVAGFRAGLADAGVELPPECVMVSQLTRDGGYTAMRELLDSGMTADCVFAVDDSMAMGAMAALRDNGWSVPADIAVAGFGDIAALRDVVPGLSTVRLPLSDMGGLAFELATSIATEPQVRAVAGTVVLRDSTPPRKLT